MANSSDRLIGNAACVAVALIPFPFREVGLIIVGVLLSFGAAIRLTKFLIIVATLQLLAIMVIGNLFASSIEVLTLTFIANNIWLLLAGFLILKDIIMPSCEYKLLSIFRWLLSFLLAGIASWPFLYEENMTTALLKTLSMFCIAMFLRLGLYFKNTYGE